MAKPPATFSIKPVVRVVIKGRRLSDNIGDYDDALLNEFRLFAQKEHIHPALRGGVFGQGIHLADYTQENAERIRKWLVDHGAKRTEFMG